MEATLLLVNTTMHMGASQYSVVKIDSDAKYSHEIANLRGENSSLSTAIQVVQSALDVKNL